MNLNCKLSYNFKDYTYTTQMRADRVYILIKYLHTRTTATMNNENYIHAFTLRDFFDQITVLLLISLIHSFSNETLTQFNDVRSFGFPCWLINLHRHLFSPKSF